MDESVAIVRLPNGLTQRATIRADDSGEAGAMPEAQYARGCVLRLDRPQERKRPAVGRCGMPAASPSRIFGVPSR
jgi:hypothetical protein